jgi:hypothetical protein
LAGLPRRGRQAGKQAVSHSYSYQQGKQANRKSTFGRTVSRETGADRPTSIQVDKQIHKQADKQAAGMQSVRHAGSLIITKQASKKIESLHLKGLSHEIDFNNVDKNLQMLALISAAAGF